MGWGSWSLHLYFKRRWAGLGAAVLFASTFKEETGGLGEPGHFVSTLSKEMDMNTISQSTFYLCSVWDSIAWNNAIYI